MDESLKWYEKKETEFIHESVTRPQESSTRVSVEKKIRSFKSHFYNKTGSGKFTLNVSSTVY